MNRILALTVVLVATGCTQHVMPRASATATEAPPPKSDAEKERSAAAQQLIMQARQAGTKKQGDAPDFAGSIEKLEQAIELDPDNPMALAMIIELSNNQAEVYEKNGDQDKVDSMRLAAARYLRLLKQRPEPLTESQAELAPKLFYNEARVLARQGQGEKAVKALKESIEAGFKDQDAIRQESDFGSIRESPEFQQLIK
jgi:tetratricopeptide (TPR) repeat protein